MKNKIVSIVTVVGSALCMLVMTLTVVHPSTLQASITKSVLPIVVSQQPPANSFTWPLTTAVVLTYDQAISPTSVTSRTFVVHAMQTGLLTEVYSVAGSTITLDPSMPFKPGELIQVTATTATLNLSGQQPLTPTVWQFRTAPTAGSGIFASQPYTIPGWEWLGTNMALGDFNDDDFLDVFVVPTSHPVNTKPNVILFNDGNGTFVESDQQLAPSNGEPVVTGDIDNDADLDILVPSTLAGFPGRIWLNSGNGYFYDSGFILDLSEISDLGDLNGDGYLDFIGYRYDIGTRMWLNNGQGYFTYTQQTIEGRVKALGDLDNDGDLDLITSGGTSVQLNDGQGLFTPTGQYISGGRVILGDLNQNGHLDLVFTQSYSTSVWFNNGDAFFTDSHQQLGSEASTLAVLADFDNDNDLDAYIAYGSNPGIFVHKIWVNSGSGYFTEGQNLYIHTAGPQGVGDIDNDGDIDIFVGTDYYNFSEDFIIHINQDEPIVGLQAVNSGATVLGKAVVFTATVVGGPVHSYSWDFGDGQVGSGAVVSHVYTATGTYTAVVTATNDVSTVTATTSVLITTTLPPPEYTLYLPFVSHGETAVIAITLQLAHPYRQGYNAAVLGH